MFGEIWMGIVKVKTRMTEHVQAVGRIQLLDGIADGTVRPSRFTFLWNTMSREFDFFNCDLRPAQG